MWELLAGGGLLAAWFALSRWVLPAWGIET